MIHNSFNVGKNYVSGGSGPKREKPPKKVAKVAPVGKRGNRPIGKRRGR